MTSKFDPKKHHRRSIRLKGFDYTQSGAYYITIVTYQRQHVFGVVVNGVMHLNELGQIAHDEWFKTALLRPYVELFEDEFVVMPNHAHGIIWIEHGDGGDTAALVGARRRRAPTVEQFGKPIPQSIPTIVRAYKSAVTYAVNALQDQRGAVLWQRNYYEHIIRDEKDLQAKRDYILSNPLNWEDDDENIKR
jgi:REP element-mobilizing transposase RayT